MKADAITAKILQDARAGAAQTLSEARQRAEKMRKDADAQLEQKRRELEEQTQQECKVLRDRMLRMAELDQRKALLAAKRDVIDEAFEVALGAMRVMGEDQQRAYNRRVLLEVAQGGEELIIAKNDEKLFDEAFIDSINQALATAGKAPVTRSKQRRETGGGFILKKAGLEVNCTYFAMLSQFKSALEAEVAQMLFD